jgi:hypothetical protein
LKAEDVQVLSDADGVAAFFGRLGYNTNGRTIQTPANLGITGESLVRRIRKVELIADDDGLFQVYLFQLPTLTLADARALAAAFRNRAGNSLLVLTANFDRLDFVLVEKYLPSGENGRGIALTQIKVRPRTLSVERRKPEPAQLRVLRRFTWTASDTFAQHEKLLAAYAVAYWSEEHFDNRALFSDYFLKQRLPLGGLSGMGGRSETRLQAAAGNLPGRERTAWRRNQGVAARGAPGANVQRVGLPT